MKRFNLRNKKNGLRFQVHGDALPDRQPEWGAGPVTKRKAQCDEWELANGVTAGVDPESGEELWACPDVLQVVEEDMTAEIAAKADAVNRLVALRQAVQDADVDALFSGAPAPQRQFLKAVRRSLIQVLKFVQSED